jgi:hypothetical protein
MSSPPSRRNTLSIVAGILMVVVGSLVSVGIYTQVGHTQEVITVVNPVARGEIIDRTNLMVVRIGVDPLLKPIPGSRINDITGMYAATDLVPGSLLVSGSVGERPRPAHGEAAVGVALRDGEYPDHELAVGDHVLLVAMADRFDSPENPTSYPGVIASLSTGQGGSLMNLTVIVSAHDAPTLASWSAHNRIALVLLAREH